MRVLSDIALKLGDTFFARCTYRDATGNPVNLSTAGIAIKSSVRSADGNETWPLTFVLLDQVTNPGQYILHGDTSSWTIGKNMWDIRFSVRDTETDIDVSTSTKTKIIHFGVPVS